MDEFTSGVESATVSVQSSIIKPRFRNEDTEFSTMSMYEDDDVFQHLTASVKFALPGSNRTLFSRSNYYTGLFYTLLRYVLSLWFTIYHYYLWLDSQIEELSTIAISLVWQLLMFLPFPEDVSVVGPASVQSATSIRTIKSPTSFRARVLDSFNQTRLLPTKIGNLILEKSLFASVPRNRLQIRQVTGRMYVPDHIAFIFEMSALVVPQPPEVPVPFLDYEKRIVVPDKKEVAKVLAKRAEWSSLHHTHKAAETFRVIYEAAKCISWAACSGVRTVTVFESNGYAWKDMQKILGVSAEELKNLTSGSYQVSDSIKLVNLDTGEIVNVYDQEETSARTQLQTDSHTRHQKNKVENELEEIFEDNAKSSFPEEEYATEREEAEAFTSHTSEFLEEQNGADRKTGISELEPAPESIVDDSVGIDSMDPESADLCHTFRTSLTVFFMSNKTTNPVTFRALRIKQEVAKRLNDSSFAAAFAGTEEELVHYPINPDYAVSYTDPELILKFCTSTQMPYSLSGYPLVANNDGNSGPNTFPVFLSEPRPANFPQFVRGLVRLNSVLRENAKNSCSEE
ncbi:hypothetical protein PMKS-001626 [Pichia membranifaciens]|uniref:Uncharacterized protein n=1 Tax=Pichia membranifaciens TaxID=4926 RepID=A0A1Q2YF23_9ASCO|nr:hypothetical protein PMKS-001626 [Pichia membranifaciens]